MGVTPESDSSLVLVGVRYCTEHDGIANEDDHLCDFNEDDSDCVFHELGYLT